MTKYVISGYIGFDNFGDEAVAGLLINHLKKLNAEKITVLSANPEKTSEIYGVESCGFLNFLKPILRSDVLISGGGSLLQDITSLKSLLYYLAVIMTAIVSGKKVLIYAQGFSEFRTKIGKWLTSNILKYCQKISVRDVQSQKYLLSLGLESELVTDPVFGIEIPKNSYHSGLGVQLRGCEALGNEFLSKLAFEISKNFKNQEIKLFSLQDNIDLPVIEKFAEMLSGFGCISKIYKNTSIHEVIHEISNLEYLISMRFHACLVGAKAGVKILGIRYDKKVKNLAENVGFPSINMFGCEVEEGLKLLTEQDCSQYIIPEFKFPEIIP